MKRFLLSIVILFSLTSIAFGQVANGKLQLHFIDVGQGDAAVLISPKGEVVMFDDGVNKFCDMPVAYIEQLGITKIDYHIASHYHDDHIGCTKEILDKFPLQKIAYDRGNSYPSQIFKRYEQSVGAHRKTAVVGDKIILDAATATPVTIEIVALNGAGVDTTNENDLSVDAVIHFGKFDAEMGGDLSGYKTGNYEDIESVVAGKMNQVEVYKVHHHCSRYSTNDKWLSTIKPKVGIISASGTIGKNYNHPTDECLERLHKAGVKTYWTEIGSGAEPDPEWDVVGKNIVIEAEPNSDTFTVNYNWSKTDTYPVWEAANPTPAKEETYAWSKNSKTYHYIDCSYVSKINPANLEEGKTPPAGKKLHEGCPKGKTD
jgi:beta-lactamase superfamily II metal-dependent hydrolase